MMLTMTIREQHRRPHKMLLLLLLLLLSMPMTLVLVMMMITATRTMKTKAAFLRRDRENPAGMHTPRNHRHPRGEATQVAAICEEK